MMLKVKWLTPCLSATAAISMLSIMLIKPSLAQVSKGTAGFLSGAGNTTSSNSSLSLPSSKSWKQQSLENNLSNLNEGNEIQKKLSRIIQTFSPTFPIEIILNKTFENYLSLTVNQAISIQETITLLQKIKQITGKNQAIIYIFFSSSSSAISQFNTESTQEESQLITQSSTNNLNIKKYNNQSPILASTSLKVTQSKSSDQLQLLMITSQGVIPLISIQNADRREVLTTVRGFEQNLSKKADSSAYKSQAKQLYQWIIAPIQDELIKQDINNITFILDNGLRTLPIAALYNEKTNRYVIEDFSVGLMPSLSLTDLTPRARKDIEDTQVLAMGAETFVDKNPLPAVPIELSEITQKILKGNTFLNNDFTVNNLKKALDTQQFNIVHLATHGEFQSGDRSNSYIYFNDQKLNLDQFSQLGLDRPKIDLLVLSACRTALGDPNAELGFSGLAVKTGVRTALGSLWNVSDEGTLALMTLFYDQLKTAPMKSEALRQAQLALLKGDFQIKNNQLILSNNLQIALTPELAQFFSQSPDLSHPYYWSAFTLIGNPW